MKRTIAIVIFLFFVSITRSQVTAVDCSSAVNICTSSSFSIAPAGTGFVDFTTSSNISNPVTNSVGIIPPGGAGCLYAGELNPTWMIINVQSSGTLEFSMGAGAGAQTGCYDWIMWPYTASTCSGINSNSLAPVRCCWNTCCSGGTGLASSTNIPVGACSTDFGLPLSVNCGDNFIMCFSNYSSATTAVPLSFFGSAGVFCAPFPCATSIGEKDNRTVNASIVDVFPNPNNGTFKLQINNRLPNGEIRIFNTLGQKVHEQNVDPGINNINTIGLTKGLYYFNLYQDGKKTSNGKITIE